jgi:hypothetical protein
MESDATIYCWRGILVELLFFSEIRGATKRTETAPAKELPTRTIDYSDPMQSRGLDCY